MSSPNFGVNCLSLMGRCLSCLLLLAAMGNAQTAAPPQPFSWIASVSVPAGAACTTSAPCLYRLYRLTGTCPSILPPWPSNPTLPPPTGWSQILVTGPNALTAVDTTTAYSTTYAYVVTAKTDTLQSPPSSCLTVTTIAPPATALGAPTGFKQP
jgi:hypothetical protein